MANVKASDIKSLGIYEREAGIDNGAPIGEHQVVAEQSEVRVDKLGNPVLFTLQRVKGGDFNKRTIPQTYRWFVAEVDGDGNAKPKEKIASGNGFARKQTLDVLKAAFGKNIAEWPKEIEVLPGKDSTPEDVKEFFSMVAPVLKGRGFTVTVSAGMKDGVETGFQNFVYSAAKEVTAFKL